MQSGSNDPAFLVEDTMLSVLLIFGFPMLRALGGYAALLSTDNVHAARRHRNMSFSCRRLVRACHVCHASSRLLTLSSDDQPIGCTRQA